MLITALIARELHGAATAQAWTAWGMVTTSAVLLFGHVLLTSVVAWGLICLCLLGAALTVLIGLPNVIYQLTHDLPQLRMRQALSQNNGGDVRTGMWPLLLVVLLGPPLVVLWVAGLRALWRDRRVRFFVVVFVVVVAFTFVSGGT